MKIMWANRKRTVEHRFNKSIFNEKVDGDRTQCGLKLDMDKEKSQILWWRVPCCFHIKKCKKCFKNIKQNRLLRRHLET